MIPRWQLKAERAAGADAGHLGSGKKPSQLGEAQLPERRRRRRAVVTARSAGWRDLWPLAVLLWGAGARAGVGQLGAVGAEQRDCV